MNSNYSINPLTEETVIQPGDWFICQDSQGGLWPVRYIAKFEHWQYPNTISEDDPEIYVQHADGVNEIYRESELTPRIVSVVVTAQEVA